MDDCTLKGKVSQDCLEIGCLVQISTNKYTPPISAPSEAPPLKLIGCALPRQRPKKGYGGIQSNPSLLFLSDFIMSGKQKFKAYISWYLFDLNS